MSPAHRTGQIGDFRRTPMLGAFATQCRAFQDREQIFEYLAERALSGAANVMARLRAAIRHLTEHPESGHPTDIKGVRVMFIGRYSYKTFYRIGDGVIEILHVRHTSRLPGELG